MRFETIASGSSGNCIYIGSETTHLLVDVGISRKRTAGALKDLDLSLQDIDGILITHEHSDHIGGLSMIAKQTQMPIYATRGTSAAIRRSPAGESIDPERFVPIRADEKQTIKDLTINPMSISHDAAEPVGYRILYGSRKAVVCTDLGCFTDYTVECLKNTDVLLLEANHDINMLQVGPYPGEGLRLSAGGSADPDRAEKRALGLHRFLRGRIPLRTDSAKRDSGFCTEHFLFTEETRWNAPLSRLSVRTLSALSPASAPILQSITSISWTSPRRLFRGIST